ncbi:MAG: ParA family protein [Acidobacteria bacterium]|nr:ParA family protein [Acidobacteriota bacterium]
MKAVITIASLSRAGKSTIAACLAAEFALRGHNTLLVDCDPRADATAHFMPPEKIHSSLADALIGLPDRAGGITGETFPLGGVVSPTVVERLGIVPGHIRFARFERVAPTAILRLKAEVEDLADSFDYALIDTPPSLGLILSACLIASSHVLVPVTGSHDTPVGLDCLTEMIEEVHRSHPRLEALALAVDLVEPGTHLRTLRRQTERQLRAMFKTVITRRDEIAACRASHLPVQLYAPGSAGAALFARLADEVMCAVNQSSLVPVLRSEL